MLCDVHVYVGIFYDVLDGQCMDSIILIRTSGTYISICGGWAQIRKSEVTHCSHAGLNQYLLRIPHYCVGLSKIRLSHIFPHKSVFYIYVNIHNIHFYRTQYINHHAVAISTPVHPHSVPVHPHPSPSAAWLMWRTAVTQRRGHYNNWLQFRCIYSRMRFPLLFQGTWCHDNASTIYNIVACFLHQFLCGTGYVLQLDQGRAAAITHTLISTGVSLMDFHLRKFSMWSPQKCQCHRRAIVMLYSSFVIPCSGDWYPSICRRCIVVPANRHMALDYCSHIRRWCNTGDTNTHSVNTHILQVRRRSSTTFTPHVQEVYVASLHMLPCSRRLIC